MSHVRKLYAALSAVFLRELAVVARPPERMRLIKKAATLEQELHDQKKELTP
jgi:hypothetical protein